MTFANNMRLIIEGDIEASLSNVISRNMSPGAINISSQRLLRCRTTLSNALVRVFLFFSPSSPSRSKSVDALIYRYIAAAA